MTCGLSCLDNWTLLSSVYLSVHIAREFHLLVQECLHRQAGIADLSRVHGVSLRACTARGLALFRCRVSGSRGFQMDCVIPSCLMIRMLLIRPSFWASGLLWLRYLRSLRQRFSLSVSCLGLGLWGMLMLFTLGLAELTGSPFLIRLVLLLQVPGSSRVRLVPL
nr:hypothetical protein [Martellivirales sp.]